MADFLTDKPAQLQRAFLVGVQTDKMADGEGAELLLELKELVENLRIAVTRSVLINLRRPTPALLLGSGKAQELVDLAKADGADVIVFDEALSPAQQRNWEELSGLAVIDRQEVILEIFSDQKAVFVFGSAARAHPWPCQKQPLTKTATRSRGM